MTTPDNTSPASPLRRLRAETRLIWCDLEMTGLSPERDRIMEAAFIITDGDFRIIAESDSWAVRQPKEVLDAMDNWNRRTHGNSGLTERCLNSIMDVRDVERKVLAFMRAHTAPNQSPICGNSICQDRRFMAVHMPEAEAFFHYRNFDASVLKIFAQLYRPDIARAVEQFKNAHVHRALEDTRDSIREMRYYTEHLLKTQ
ncbi:MAG: oligoribonuclease [Gammaproteobacteria bacterium]